MNRSNSWRSVTSIQHHVFGLGIFCFEILQGELVVSNFQHPTDVAVHRFGYVRTATHLLQLRDEQTSLQAQLHKAKEDAETDASVGSVKYLDVNPHIACMQSLSDLLFCD